MLFFNEFVKLQILKKVIVGKKELPNINLIIKKKKITDI